MPLNLDQAAAAAVRTLQGWYGADSYASSTGLYHWDDPNFNSDVGGSVNADLINAYGYHDAYQDTLRWWNSANAITALIDYMLITNTDTYLSVVEKTFVQGQTAFTINQGAVEAGAGADAAAGALYGAEVGADVGGAVGAVVGGIVGGLAGLFGGGGVAAATFARIYLTNFINPSGSGYYDDEGWWALAWLKAYDLTNDDRYLNMAVTIFDDMTNGWDDTCCGGIYWVKNQDLVASKPYKNAISNELFMAVGAGLYRRLLKRGPADPTAFENFLSWAEREWRWFDNSGLINQDNYNLINDSLTTSTSPSGAPQVPCRNDNSTDVWTYNQGVILGALCDLAEITGSTSYLRRAKAIADGLITNTVAPYGTPHESGVYDNGILMEYTDLTSSGPNQDINNCQFKGIFVRNLAYLCIKTRAAKYRAFIKRNAASAIQNMNDANQFGHRWDQEPDMADFVRQTAGVDLLNAALAVQAVPSDLSYLRPLLLGSS